MIKAVIFDLDGTLLNRDESVKKFINSQYQRLNQWVGHVPKETYTTRFFQLDNRGYVWKDTVYQQIVDHLKIEGITSNELLQDYLDNFKDSCVPFPNLISTLEDLRTRNIVLGIITNGFGQFQMDNIKALGIESYFETTLISEWEGIKKPNPKIFKRALEKLNVQPGECLFVGDHPLHDVKAARDVGMKGVWKRNGFWDYVEADYIVKDLAEIPNLTT